MEIKGSNKIIKAGEDSKKTKPAKKTTKANNKEKKSSNDIGDKNISATSNKMNTSQQAQPAAPLPQSMNHNLKNRIGNTASKKNIGNKLAVAITKSIKAVDFIMNYVVNTKKAGGNSEVLKYTRSPAVFGIWVTFIALSSFLIWGVFAPLNSAAVAQGQLVLESKKRYVQHPEGGIIERIYVRNGDEVSEGELLISLNKTTHAARKDAIKTKYLTFLAENARILAERDEISKVKFADELLLNITNYEVAKIMQAQERLFQTRKEAIEGAISAKKEKLKQYEAQHESAEAQKKAIEKQIELVQENIDSIEELVKKHNVSKEKLRQYENHMAELQGRLGRAIGEVLQTKEAMAQENIEILNIKRDFANKVQEALRKNQEDLAEAFDSLKQIEEAYRRLDIVSPIKGVVNNLLPNFTEGGTITRDHPIMEIIPVDDELVVEARIAPEDIDVVRVGQYANIRLLPFKSRVVPPLEGKVVYVSADIIHPQHQGDIPHYKIRIEINKDSLKRITEAQNIELYPGMPGSVTIEIGTRTLLKYLLDPITMSFEKAFIEQ